MKLLVVDDATEVIEAVTVSFNLQWRETEVLGASDGETALDLIEQEHRDLVLLDIAMPGMDGYETLRQIRLFSDIPVIMLTARDGVLDKVKGLELGADDYMTKPFDHLELLARVKALLRRLDAPRPTTRTPSFQAGDLAVDFGTRSVTIGGQSVSLTDSRMSNQMPSRRAGESHGIDPQRIDAETDGNTMARTTAKTTPSAPPIIRGPATGRMVKPFALHADGGRVVRPRDFRQRFNLVLVVHHGSACRGCQAALDDVELHLAEIEATSARVLAIGPDAEERPAGSRPDHGPAILRLADPDGTVARIHEIGAPAVIVADRFGEMWAAWEGGADHRLPDAREIIEWLEFIEIQCPECHPPEPWE